MSAWLFKRIGNIFLKGIATVLPVFLSLYIVYWLLATTERGLGQFLRHVVPESLYLPGMGLAAGVLIVFGAGVLANLWGFRALFGWWEQLMGRIPLVKSVYGAVRDFIGFFSGEGEKKFSKVVRVSFANGIYLVGFVTREDGEKLLKLPKDEKRMAVYLPMSYQIGGYTAFVPSNAVEPLEMNMEDAMRMILTAGVSR